MSAPSENMPISAAASRDRWCCGICRISSARRSWWRSRPPCGSTATSTTSCMQATTFSIAVFGLSVVLGLCGQINLAQAAFFGLGAYAVGLGNGGLHLSFWLCLVGRLRDRAARRRLPRHVDAAARRALSCDGDDLVPADRHAGDDQRDLAHPRSGRRIATSAGPICSSRRKSISPSASAMLAIVGYLVWHLPDTQLGRAMRAVRDNELAAGVDGIDVFRTKVYAFALCARARRTRRADCSRAASPMSARISSRLRN